MSDRLVLVVNAGSSSLKIRMLEGETLVASTDLPVTSEGFDAAHVLRALGEIAKLYELQYWVFVVVVLVLAVTIRAAVAIAGRRMPSGRRRERRSGSPKVSMSPGSSGCCPSVAP